MGLAGHKPLWSPGGESCRLLARRRGRHGGPPRVALHFKGSGRSRGTGGERRRWGGGEGEGWGDSCTTGRLGASTPRYHHRRFYPNLVLVRAFCRLVPPAPMTRLGTTEYIYKTESWRHRPRLSLSITVATAQQVSWWMDWGRLNPHSPRAVGGLQLTVSSGSLRKIYQSAPPFIF